MKLERKVSLNPQGMKLLIIKDVLSSNALYGAAIGNKVIALKKVGPGIKFGSVFYTNSCFLPSTLINLAGLEADEVVRYAKGNDGWFFIFSRDHFNGDLKEAQENMLYENFISSETTSPPTGEYAVLPVRHENQASLLDLSDYLPQSTNSVLCTFRSLKDTFWLEIRKVPESTKYIPEDNLMFYGKNLPTIPCNDSTDGLTFESKVRKGKVKLPKGFIKRCREFSHTANNFPVYRAKDVLIIEAPLYACDKCGKAIRSTEHSKKICLCPDCAKKI